jgi:hypothetical protein
MSAISAFNKILVDFAKNLETTFPEDKDFLVFRKGIEDLSRFNTMMPVQLFRTYIAPVHNENNEGEIEVVDIKQKILNNDCSFFVDEMDYAKKLDEHDANDAYSFNTINKLKKYWKTLTPQGQAIVMKYLSSLVRVAEQIKN